MKKITAHLATIVIIIIITASVAGCTIFKAFIHQGPRESVARVENVTIPSSDSKIRVRVYTPAGDGPFPTLLYSHGGGWTGGNVYTHDKVCRYLSSKVACIVISVDYRKAPKYKFPTAVEDTYAALQWAVINAVKLHGDPKRTAVSGDSAGGNIAAAVCLMAKDRGGPHIVFQLLAYPATNLSSLDTESYQKFATGYDLTKATVEKLRDNYLRNAADRFNPYASPLLAKDLRNLPPALVITGEHDVLRDDGEAYAEKLKQSGVQAHSFRCMGIAHGAAYWAVDSNLVREALTQAAAALRSAFYK